MVRLLERLVIGCWIALACGCNSPTAPKEAFVNVVNVGSTDIGSLVLQFPNGEANVGDVRSGSESGFVSSSSAAYRYAAFDFIIDDVRIRQPVTDWVGEKALRASFVTYTVAVVIANGGPRIEIRSVTERQ